MGLRFAPAPPVPGALRSLAACLAVCAALGCAGGKSGPTGSGGNSGSTGSGSAGKTGAGSAGTTGSGAAGSAGSTGSGSAGSAGSAGTTGSGAAGTTGSGSAGSTGSGNAGTTGHAGTTGTGAAGTTGSGVDASVSDAACQSASYTFAPKIPTVFILVDRSGSEFTDATTGVFFNLRTAVLQVLAQLNSTGTQMRVGLGAFVGDHATGACVADFDSVAIGDIATNYTAIANKYNALGPLLPFGSKADTPMSAVIPMVKASLQSDTGTGQKYMLVVTDAESDFCDDGNSLCPTDAVTYRIQDMFAANIGTLVIGLPSQLGSGTAFNTSALQDFANAGAGLTVAVPSVGGVGSATDIYNQCNGYPPWKALWTAAARTGMVALSTYGTPGGAATVFAPTTTSTTDLANQIAAAISGVKSCSFDLSDVNGKSLKVDLTKLAQANITIQGATIPQDATNGWSMSSPSELVLNGSACSTWRMPNNTLIAFAFPCSTIIFE